MSTPHEDLKTSLWSRLSSSGVLNLDDQPLRKARVDNYLDGWIQSLEPLHLTTEKKRLLEDGDGEKDFLFLSQTYPDLESEWEFFFQIKGDEDLEKAGERQARVLWGHLWDLHWRSEVYKAATQNFSELKSDLIFRLKSLEETENKVQALFGPRDLGWDLESGDWQHKNLEKLWSLMDNLKLRKDVQKLAKLFGRGRQGRDLPDEGKKAEETVFYEEGEPQPGRTEIHGLKKGAALGELLPQEMALLALPETSTLFWARWAESSLLGWDYRTRQPQSLSTAKKAGGKSPQPGGPLVICLDTSGSMRGKPEEVAKTLVLALVKETQLENRPLYLINYSLELKALDLGSLKESFSEFLEFLGYSFYGGTDLNPALLHALGLLARGEAWRDADILVISDFSQPKLRPEVVKQMKELQKTGGHRYYCLSVSVKTLKDLLHVFDGGWVYNLSPKRAEGIDADTLKKLP